jgi:hypothetical protein
MAITSSTYEIPSWLGEHCSSDLNSPYEWMTRPLLYTGTQNMWAMGTDGKGFFALKLPASIYPTSADYLAKPDKHVIETIKSLVDFDRGSHPLIDVPEFKASLTKLTRSCSLCENTRQADCGFCEASTEVTCTSCAGKGSFPCVTCRKPDHCKTCDGLGVIECKRCTEGKVACSCTTTKDMIARLSLNGEQGNFNLTLLKNLLVRINTKCHIKIEGGTRLTLWDKHQVIGLMGVWGDGDSYQKLLVDDFISK